MVWSSLGDSSGEVLDLSPIGSEIQSVNTQTVDSAPTANSSSHRLVFKTRLPVMTHNKIYE